MGSRRLLSQRILERRAKACPAVAIPEADDRGEVTSRDDEEDDAAESQAARRMAVALAEPHAPVVVFL